MCVYACVLYILYYVDCCTRDNRERRAPLCLCQGVEECEVEDEDDDDDDDDGKEEKKKDLSAKRDIPAAATGFNCRRGVRIL